MGLVVNNDSAWSLREAIFHGNWRFTWDRLATVADWGLEFCVWVDGKFEELLDTLVVEEEEVNLDVEEEEIKVEKSVKPEEIYYLTAFTVRGFRRVVWGILLVHGALWQAVFGSIGFLLHRITKKPREKDD